MKEILKKTFCNIFASRKGLTWLASYIVQIILTFQLAFFPFALEKSKYIFYIILAEMLIQLITLGFITFEKIKIEYKKQ